MDKKKRNRLIDFVIKVVLIIIIIFLLIRNCGLINERDKYMNSLAPGGNIKIIEIKCDDNGCKQKEIESLGFNQQRVSVKEGETINLIVKVKPSELSSSKLSWKSSDSSIATVNSNGVVKGIKPGVVTITVMSSNGKIATCTVEVLKNAVDVTSIKLTPDDDFIGIGSVTQVNAKIEPENATNRDLVWTSSDPSIAIVDSNGVVKGLKSGKVTITAKTKDGKVIGTTVITINKGDFDVYDDKHTPVEWNGATDLDIFENSIYTVKDVIAPESSNTYQFSVKNSTECDLKYEIDFIESNPYHINMKYKLKKNDKYIVDHYVSASELDIENAFLNSGINDTYYLEWKWISSSNDTEIGANPDSKYGLRIEIKAESTNG